MMKKEPKNVPQATLRRSVDPVVILVPPSCSFVRHIKNYWGDCAVRQCMI